MEKKYWVDVYFFQCPTCGKTSLGKTYFFIYEKAEIGQAKASGLLEYQCIHCGRHHSSDRVRTNGEVMQVSPEEALANGISWESKGAA